MTTLLSRKIEAIEMATLNLHIPLSLNPEHGFYSQRNKSEILFGFSIRLKSDRPYTYLEFQNVPPEQADDLLERFRRCLPWAAVRLDFGILSDHERIKHVESGTFDGQFSTAYPTCSNAQPLRIDSNHRSEEADLRLFAALREANEKTKLGCAIPGSPLVIASELFAAADFEVTPNSRFLLLATVFEVLANPKTRPEVCVVLVQELIDKAKKAENTEDHKRKDAFKALRQSAEHLKQESIRSSVRKLATKASETFGDPEPERTGKRAAELYDKRSDLVHEGHSVTWADVAEIRKLVREALAVEAGCHEHFRERIHL
jgi:hypothetical protein